MSTKLFPLAVVKNSHSARAPPYIGGDLTKPDGRALREPRVTAVKVIPLEGARQARPLSAVVWSRAKIQQTRLLNLEVVVEAIQHLPAVNLRSHRGMGQ